MKYSKQNPPLVCMMTNSTNYKNADKGKMVGVCWHSTGANNKDIKRYCQPSPSDPKYSELISLIGKNNNRNSWNEQTVWAGVNAWIGELADDTVTSVQALPWNYAPWGVASGWRGSLNWFNGNFYGQFEICEDSLTNKSYFDKVYKEACEFTAYLCLINDIDPLGYVNINGAKVPTIVCHRDSYDYGLGSCHADVRHWFNRYGKDMDDVRQDVAKLLAGASIDTPSQPESKPVVTPSQPSTSTEIKVKDIVTIKSGATYYSGNKVVPAWVINNKWIVKSIKGDRVVIDKSLDGKASICSPINIKYLTVVSVDEPVEIKPVVKPEASKAVVPNITYAVQTKRHGILPDVKNREDYAGFNNSEIVAIKIGVDVGSVKYRVHTVAGQWLPYVTGCNWDDYNNGYAGDEVHAIDAIEVYYTTDASKTGGKYYKACYQVRGKGNSSCWANQYDNEKGNGQDGYAGAFGVPIVEVRMSLE